MKKTIAVIMTIITLTVVLCACTSKIENAGTTTTEQITETTTAEMVVETTVEETTNREKSTQPSVPEYCTELELEVSDIPIDFEGVKVKRVLFHKATEERRNELSTYGDDPNVDNELYVFVEGNSADLKIFYKTSATGNIKSSVFYEDSMQVWNGDYGPYELRMVEKADGITVSGFSSDVLQITQRFQMFRECLKLDEEAFVKRVTIILV